MGLSVSRGSRNGSLVSSCTRASRNLQFEMCAELPRTRANAWHIATRHHVIVHGFDGSTPCGNYVTCNVWSLYEMLDGRRVMHYYFVSLHKYHITQALYK